MEADAPYPDVQYPDAQYPDTPYADVQYAQVGTIRLAYESFGRVGDPTVLLVMGQGSQLLGWPEPLCRALVAQGLRVVRFDHRDCGLSTHLPSRRFAPRHLSPYTLDDLAADALALVDQLGLHDVHVVGMSMGAMLAQLLAIGAPNRVLSLTCIASSTGSRRVGRPRLLLLRRIPLRRKALHRDAAGSLFARILQAIGSPAYPVDERLLHELGARCYDRGYDPAGSRRHLFAVLRAHDRTSALRQLRVPTLVVHGTADPLVSPSGGQALAAAIPGARLVTVPGMGHDLPPQLWPLLVAEICAVVARGERGRVPDPAALGAQPTYREPRGREPVCREPT